MALVDIIKKVFGTKSDRDMKKIRPILEKVLAAYETVDKLDNDEKMCYNYNVRVKPLKN